MSTSRQLSTIAMLVAAIAWAGPLACGASDNVGTGATGSGGAAGVAAGGDGGISWNEQTGGSGGQECLSAEICDDDIDNDCNGLVDDDCACEPGTSEPCYDGPAAVAGVGICLQGERFCDTKAEFPTWGPCQGWVSPATEICDVAMLDEDCDGSANEECECADGEILPCGNGVGECVEGTQECIAGVLGPCVGAVGPTAETCNNKDDDCDGPIDEGLTQACGSNVGECSPGTSICAAGQWSVCSGEVGPTTEICNNKDDDCDGLKDENLSQACGTNEGECTEGSQICTNGMWGACSDIGPTTEICNNLDDDCDGVTDEGCVCTNGDVQPCGTNAGECMEGTQTCTMGQWGNCVGSVGPTVEICNNKDDDCDGPIDENLSLACGTNVGECSEGTMTCSAGQWSSCVGEIGPATEICNNKDDDCDGLKDELLTQQCGVTAVGVCSYGTSTCSNGNWGNCVGNIDPVTEICANGLDDDCDGGIDEADECPDSPPLCNCPATPIITEPLETETLAASCSDPDGGVMTYQWVVTAAPPGSTSQPAAPNSASTSFFVDLAGSYTLTLYATDDENNTVTCVVLIDSIPPQDLHVELVWDEAWGDADLHMIQAGVTPAGNWFLSEQDCFFGNTTAMWPPNGGAGNATLDIDDTDGYGPENINISNNPQAGTYNIGVAYYCQHSVAQPGDPPIDPGDGPVTATVNIYCGGSLIATYGNINLDKTGRFVHVATVDWPTCSGSSVNQKTWTALVQPSAYASPLHCALPCNNNNDCGGGEECGSGGTCVLL